MHTAGHMMQKHLVMIVKTILGSMGYGGGISYGINLMMGYLEFPTGTGQFLQFKFWGKHNQLMGRQGETLLFLEIGREIQQNDSFLDKNEQNWLLLEKI